MRIDINHTRGDTFVYEFPQTDTTAVANIWFTLKDRKCEADAGAIVQVDEATGLLIVNGAVAPDSSKATIIHAGRVVTVTIDAIVTSQIPTVYPLIYDLQLQQGDDIRTAYNGRWSNVSDVTRDIDNGDLAFGMLWPEGGVVLWPEGEPVLWP